ncbi:MAG: peptidase S8, partial [Spirulina sp. DLM2.Bin59]
MYATARNEGIVHFAAAGNSAGSTPVYPASLPSVVAVGAIDRHQQVYSGNHTGVFICAPGVDILTTDRPGSSGYNEGDYFVGTGTSASSPYVAGVAALMLSVNPELSPVDVENILRETAR